MFSKYRVQGCHGRFLAGKDAIVAVTSPALPFSIFQNPGKDQALVALPPVAALNHALLYLLCATTYFSLM